MFSMFILLGLFAVVVASPIRLQPRIAQVIADATAKWEKACDAAGGGDKCNPISVTAMGTLLFAPDACAQQNSADNMIDLAHQLNHDKEMIRLAQIFAQSPRNSPDKLSLDYCQQEPKNAELKGLFPCQFLGVDPQTFKGGLKAGSPGTIPLGLNTSVSPAGSCPAHREGPVEDGVQLSDLVQDPDVGYTNTTFNSTSTSASSSNSTSPSDSDTSFPASSGTDASDDGDTSFPYMTNSTTDSGCDTSYSVLCIASPSGSINATTPTPSPSSSGNDSGSADGEDFRVQNGKDAQALNAGFAKLTADSGCIDGQQACISGGFSQCVSSKFVTTQCAVGTSCFALPLVNKPGTSLACTTEGDALARIVASGVSGGVTGSS